jgi:hypothetical protein
MRRVHDSSSLEPDEALGGMRSVQEARLGGGLPVGSLGEMRKAGACFDELHGFLRFCTTSNSGATVYVLSSNVQRRQ